MKRISDLLLEQYVLGELPPEVAGEVREELARDPSLRARHEAIIRSDREILERYPAADIAVSVGARLREKRQQPADDRPADDRSADGDQAAETPGGGGGGISSTLEPAGRWALQLAIGLPAAAIVLLVFSFFIFRERLTPDDTRMKGLSPHLTAFLKTAKGAQDLVPGSLVGRGDVIQLSYTAGEARFGVILWVDGRGAITWLLPPGYNGSPRGAPLLDRQGQVILPTAYELDDAPGFERFFFVYSENPFDVAVAAEAARALSSRAGSAEKLDLALPAGVRQSSLLLKKRGPT